MKLKFCMSSLNILTLRKKNELILIDDVIDFSCYDPIVFYFIFNSFIVFSEL